MSTSKAEANAREFAHWEKQEGWRFALLVACSVEKGKGDGVNKDKGVATETPSNEKLSARAFAEKANTTAKRVLQFLKTWDEVASTNKGLKPSSELTPNDADTYELPADLPAWDGEDGVYVGEKRTGTGVRNRRVTPENVAEAIKADPEIAEAAWKAIDEQNVEYANKAALEAIQRGGKVTTCPEKPKAKDMWPDVMEEVSRAEPIHELADLIEQAHAKMDVILANGDPQGRESEFLAPVVKEIGEIYWSLSKLVVSSEVN